MDKSQVRKQILLKRKSVLNKDKLDKVIQDKCIELIKDYHCIALYINMDDEVSTRLILDCCFKSNKKVVVPKVVGNTLEFYLINSLDDTKLGTFNVLEPEVNSIVQLKDIECFVVPLVAFDANNNRIGYGKGYYDSVLKDVDCPKYGLAYSIQQVNKIEVEKHDIRLDLVITESSFFFAKKC